MTDSLLDTADYYASREATSKTRHTMLGSDVRGLGLALLAWFGRYDKRLSAAEAKLATLSRRLDELDTARHGE